MQEAYSDNNERLIDQSNRFGWLSIVLHWLSAAAVIALWILGKGIDFAEADGVEAQRRLHISIGITVWFLLALRIAWRVRSGHPRAKGLSELTHHIARASHYLLLAALTLMLVSGPLMVWASGTPIPVFTWFVVPGPFAESENLRNAVHTIHVVSANIVLWLTLLHVAGAFKHLMFHEDDSFVRMLWPGRPSDNE